MIGWDSDALEAEFAKQAIWCKQLGSPLYARLATQCANAVREPGPIARTLAPFARDPRGTLLPLRFLGVLHRLALLGEAPELARRYPSCGGDGDAAAAAAALEPVTARLADRIAALLPQVPQTNEVSRSAAVLGGFLEIASATGLPLRVLEIGASAGLNLRFDRFRYAGAGWSWGDPSSPVVLDAHFAAPPPFAGTELRVVERRGCDPHPIDATTPEGLLALRSYVWADQLDRLRLLESAAGIAAATSATVDREEAGPWLARLLATPRPGVATVVFHTVVMQYLATDERAAVIRLLERAAAAATPAAPFAHLSLEPRAGAAVALRRSPGDPAERPIARATMHGRDVRWLAAV